MAWNERVLDVMRKRDNFNRSVVFANSELNNFLIRVKQYEGSSSRVVPIISLMESVLVCGSSSQPSSVFKMISEWQKNGP